MNVTKKNGQTVVTFNKTKPGWFNNMARWEHGIEKPDYDACLLMARSEPVMVVVVERKSPLDGERNDGLGDGCVLRCPLDDIIAHGRLMPKWPDGRGGPSGDGGWVWPRRIMRPPGEPFVRQARMF